MNQNQVPKQQQQSKGKQPQNKPKRQRSKPKQNNNVSMRSAPAATGGSFKRSFGEGRNLPNGDWVGTTQEYVRILAGSVAFNVSSLSLNPGQPGTFPWLSNIAQSYESYRFESLSIEFIASCASTATGSICLMIDYDASDPAPSSLLQAVNSRSSVLRSVWGDRPLIMSSRKEDLSKNKSWYVRGGANPANTDIKLYDVGNIYVCREGQVDTANIGSILIKATVRLMTPQTPNALIGFSKYARFQGTTNAAPFSTLTAGSNLPANVTSGGTTTSTSTWLFSQPWEGVIAGSLTGTAITGITAGGTGTNVLSFQTIDAGALNLCFVCTVSCQQGETLQLVVSNTTLTACSARFGQGDF